MNNRTYICARCGSIRRRSATYYTPSGEPATPRPVCDGEEMRSLAKGYAEAAPKLSPADRVTWLAAGGHIVRKAGRRWTAAISTREIALAQEQLARYRNHNAAAG